MGFFSKIKKKIKKVFKKVVKVVKKIVKSKIFKAVVLAAAIYFTAGAIAGALAPTAGGLNARAIAPQALAGSAGMSAGTVASAASSGFSAIGSGAVAANVGGGVIGSIAQGATNLVGTAGSAIAANPGLASTIVTTGGKMLSGYAAAKGAEQAEEEERERIEKNGRYKLKMKGRDDPQGAGPEIASATEGQQVNTNSADMVNGQYQSPMAKLSNIDKGPNNGQSYYDTSTDTYKGNA